MGFTLANLSDQLKGVKLNDWQIKLAEAKCQPDKWPAKDRTTDSRKSTPMKFIV